MIGWSGTNQWPGIAHVMKTYHFIGLNKKNHVISISIDVGSELKFNYRVNDVNAPIYCLEVWSEDGSITDHELLETWWVTGHSRTVKEDQCKVLINPSGGVRVTVTLPLLLTSHLVFPRVCTVLPTSCCKSSEVYIPSKKWTLDRNCTHKNAFI